MGMGRRVQTGRRPRHHHQARGRPPERRRDEKPTERVEIRDQRQDGALRVRHHLVGDLDAGHADGGGARRAGALQRAALRSQDRLSRGLPRRPSIVSVTWSVP